MTLAEMNRVAMLSEADRERFEERAAIREFEGGQTREVAEREALAEIVATMPAMPAKHVDLFGDTSSDPEMWKR